VASCLVHLFVCQISPSYFLSSLLLVFVNLLWRYLHCIRVRKAGWWWCTRLIRNTKSKRKLVPVCVGAGTDKGISSPVLNLGDNPLLFRLNCMQNYSVTFNFSTHAQWPPAWPSVRIQNELGNVAGEAILSTWNTAVLLDDQGSAPHYGSLQCSPRPPSWLGRGIAAPLVLGREFTNVDGLSGWRRLDFDDIVQVTLRRRLVELICGGNSCVFKCVRRRSRMW